MTNRTSRISKILIVFLLTLVAAAVALTFAFVNVPIGTANAEEQVTLTVYADEGGSVTADSTEVSENDNKQLQVAPDSTVTLTAKPSAGFVFAYWYENDINTPIYENDSGFDVYDKYLAYSEIFSCPVKKETTIHAKFYKNESKTTVTMHDGWSEKQDNTYDGPQTGQFDQALIFEFVGEKWLDCKFESSMAMPALFVDGIDMFFSGSTMIMGTPLTTLLKANGDGYHRIAFGFVANLGECKITVTEKTEEKIIDENGSVDTTIKFDTKLGDVYYLEGWDSDQLHEGYAVRYGTKVEIDNGNEATISLPKNIPMVLFAVEKDKVNSTLDSEQQTTVHNCGIGVGSAKEGTYKIAQTFGSEPEQPIVAEFKEVALQPQVMVTKTVNGSSLGKEKIDNGGKISFNYGDSNLLVVEISRYASIDFSQQEYTVTVDGQSQQLEEQGSDYGFTLSNINKPKNVVIDYSYGEDYYYENNGQFSFKLEVQAGEWEKFINEASAPIEVVDDGQYSWYLDPDFSDGDDFYAYSSGLTGLVGTLPIKGYPITQIGFKVKGSGLFTMEFYPDELKPQNTQNRATNIGYKIGEKLEPDPSMNGGFYVTRMNCHEAYNNGSPKDEYKGFKDGSMNDIWFTNREYFSSDAHSEYHVVLGAGVTEIAEKEGWYQFSVSVQQDSNDTETTIWIAHGIASNCTNGDPVDGSRLTIRNVAFYNGDAYATWDAEGENVQNTEYTVSGLDATGKTKPGTVLTLTADPTDNHTFYGWKQIKGTLKECKDFASDEISDSDIEWDDKNAQFVSFEPTYRYTVGSGCSKIVAVIDKTGTYAVRNGGKLYKPEEVNKALTAAEAQDSKDKQVIVVDTATISDISVPEGVAFIIPYNVKGKYYDMGTTATGTNKVSWEQGTGYEKPVYTLTLNGENTVYGKFYVGGVIHYPDQSAQGHTSGAYSQLVLNGTLTVGSKGMLDVYGRVTGKGGITVESGGALIQPFLIADYSGGTNTQDLFNQKQTPFNRYAMINIQCAGGYTINYGGELIGHASLYFWSSITTIDQPFISYPSTVTINGKKGTVTLINLKDGASAHVVYDDNHVRVKNTNSPKTDFWDVVANSEDIGKTVITITGGASAGYMSFPLDIKTNGVAFSIPYNYELNLEGEKAVYDMPYAYKLMPGATLRIGEGATLNLTSKLYVYDWLYQYDMSAHGYPSSSELTSAGYTVNANFIVNGTFNIKSGATFLGVIQTTNTKGTAHINIDNNVTLKVDTKSANHSAYNGLIDGGCTGYDCNFASLTEISACIWDKVHWNNTSEKLLKNAFAEYKNQIYEFLKDLMPEMAQEFVPTAVGQLVQLEAGKSYTSTWLDTDSEWSFKGSPITYCSTHAKTSASNGNHTLQVATPPTIEGLSGSWRVDHDEQDCQWGQYYVADKNAFGLFADEIDAALLGRLGVSDLSNYVGFAYKLCSCVGCDHKIAIILINPSGNEFGWVGAGAVSKGHIEVPYDGGVNTVQAIIDVLKKAATDLFEENGDIKASLKEFASNFNVSLELLKDDSAAQTFNVGKYVLRVTLTDGYYLEGGVGYKTLGSNVWNIEVTIEAATLSEENVQDLVDGKLPSQQYTGSQITFEDLNIQFVGKKLQKGVDYNLSFGGNVNVIDGGTVIVTGIGNFEGSSITLHFDITPISLDGGNGLIEGVLENYEYTGKPIEPSITVLTADRTHTLEKGEDKDYTVSYSGDNVNVTGQQVTLTVTAHGNYTGTLSAQFTVAAKDMSGADVKVEGSYTYNGQAITPTLAIQFGEYSLVYDADYDIAYTGSGNHTNAGEVQFTVSYKGNFAGSKAGNKFQISPKDISSAVVTFTGQFTYDRNAHTPTRAQLTISGVEGFSDEQIKDGDVKITASDNIAAGENSATVTVEGTGNFAGKATGKFGIGKATISEVTVNGNYTYTGTAQKIALIVKAGALTLSEGEYEATYSRSDGTAEALKLTNAGAVKVSIAAISDNFQISDDISTEFDIAKRSIVGAKVTVGGVYTYNRNAHKPLAGVITVTIDDLPDVEVTFDVTGYGENTKAGQATVTVTGNGNFEDEATGEFAINKATIDKVVVNGAYTYNGIAQVIDLTVNAGDLQLNDGEYTADFGGNGLINAAKGITVTVNPEDADNFDGSATATFEIKAKDVTVALNKQTWATYNGAEQHASSEQQYWSLKAVDGNAMANDEQPNALQIKLTANGTNAGAYDIEPTWGNTNYNVTFEGKEQAFVIAKASIEIKAKDISSAMGDAIIKDYEYEFLNGTRFFNEQDRLDFEANAELKYVCDAENTQIKDYDIVLTIKADFTMTNYDIKTPQKGTYHVTDSIFAGVVFNDARHIYDAQLHKIDVGGTENLDKPSVTFTYHTGDNDWKPFPTDGVKDAGTYFIKVYITVDGHESTYEKQAQLVIDKKDISGATVTVEGEYTYNGSAISPEKAKIKVTLADWNEAITFNFEVSENTNAGAAKVTVTGNGNYKGTAKEGSFTILQRDISNAAVVVGGTYTYNRSEHKPIAQNITVTLADLQGVEVTFKVKDDGAYANNVNATTDALKATVIIEGTGNFKGEATGEFVIGKATINKVTVNGAYTYTGKAQSVSLTVKAGDLQLNDGEYAADFGGNELINAAKGIKVTVTPKDASNFDGSATATFDIAQKDISEASVKVNGTYTYNGNAILPKNEEVELTLDDFADFTFTLSSNDNTDKGTKTLYVAGTGNYAGTATGEFEILPADLTELALGGPFTYDKTEKKLVDKVMAGEIEVDGEYFDVAYMRNDEPTSDLTSAGKVKVTVTAKEQSNFTGALTQEVEIAKREVNVTLTAQSKPYSKSKPVVENSYNIGETDVLLGDSLDLTVFIVENESNEWNVGKYDLDVEIGNPNYTVGTITGNKNAFEITKRNVQITLKTQNWAVYNGQAQQPSSEDQYWSFADGAILGDDDLHISLSVEGEAKMASSYQLKYAWENENYNVTRGSDGAVFTIGRKHINVTVLEQTALYSGLDNVPAVSQLQNVAWSAQDGAICDGDSDSIGIVVRCETLASRVGDYPISADWTDKQNYDVEFDTSKAMFKVTPVTITITVHGKQSTYGDRAEQLTCDIEGLLDSDRQTVNVNSYFTLSVDVDERTSVGHHDIVCNVSGHPDNYVLNVVNDEGYEVVARKLKVEILDQNDVYGFGKSYAFDDSKWQIVDGNIVNDDDLDITLTAPVITGAGDNYVITGRCGNGNYDVEFEDGKYTVAKLDISAQNPIIFTVNAQSPSEDGTITVTFRGGAPTFFATASVEEGGQLKQLDVTISPDSVNTVGVFDITVSINDPNYAGSKTFKLVVTDRDGRTQRIIEALGNLQDIVGDMQAIEVTLEDFELVKSIAQEIAKLDPAERKLAEDDLAEYMEFIEAYNRLAEVDEEVIAAAKAVADAPIKGLFDALNALSLLATLAYIVIKGGKLI